MKRTLSFLLLVLSPAVTLAQGFTPEAALKCMTVAEGFRVRLVSCEPDVRQPLSMTFDERGRLWVIQYLQYPTPAGLKPVKVDQYLRTVYDRIPEPPPKGPKGADRITILSDPDETGRYRKAKDFVTGLNLATGLALGHGGVYVIQPPYLLFYPDKNGDDVPDGDPEVLLSGFGMEDAHAFANSIQWGPDGWLYGAQGSTVTANIRGIEFQQGIWRYHPITKEFELFAEGGGNTWGLDFDRHGNVIAGTNWGDKAMLHQVQGGYYIKGFGKHGPLHNPNTFGYFDHVPYKGFKGGHVTCGGVLYRGGAFPEQFNDQYIASNLLSNAIYWHALERKGSTFTAHFGGDLLVANDTWFRAIDCMVGPDGAVYIADWYDKRANHVDPVDTWDRTNGRIYKIEPKDAKPFSPPNLSKKTSRELVDLLSHRNAWYVREAQRMLTERRDRSVWPELRKLVRERQDQVAFDALGALYGSGGFDDDLAAELLKHPSEDVRTWTVRLLGDAKKVSSPMRERLVAIAHDEKSAVVRSQLACTAKRLPAQDGLAIVKELIRHDEDVEDLYIPLLLWWAIEDKAISNRDAVLGLFEKPEEWKRPLVSRYLVERIARRYMGEGGDTGAASCARLLAMAPDANATSALIRGMEAALDGRALAKVPAALEEKLAALQKERPGDLTLLKFAVRLGSAAAYEQAMKRITDAKAPQGDRTSLIEVLGQVGKPDCVPVLLQLFREDKTEGVRVAALSALQGFPNPEISDTALSLYPKLTGALRTRAQSLLCSRSGPALAYLRLVDKGVVNKAEVPMDQLKRIVGFNNADATKLIEKHWGKIAPATAGEKIARIRNLTAVIRRESGDAAKGKVLFEKTCATCHQLFGQGNKIGPDLTGAERKNLDFLLTSVIDPSAFVRPEYVKWDALMKDGRALDGIIVEQTPDTVTLVNAKNEKSVLRRDRMDEFTASPTSLMPEKILDVLDDQSIRDLFAYLQSDPK